MHNWPDEVRELVRLALHEDVGTGDITTLAIYAGSETGKARLIAREPGVVCGLELLAYIIQEQAPDLIIHALVQEGDRVDGGAHIATLEGALSQILTLERTLLNFLQRMSGIATLTRQFADILADYSTRVLDTRKTVPGHRYLDKLAVRTGGGTNHRMRLDDRFLIKENHIRMAGGIEQAIQACDRWRQQYAPSLAIEIEVTCLEEVEQVIEAGKVEYIMLDNMSPEHMKQAVSRIDARFYTEASGNVTLDNLVPIARSGVDFISSGALTHSVRALDISLLLDV